jgi:hypothetical protein
MKLTAIHIAVVDIAREYLSGNRELDRQDLFDLEKPYFRL